MKISLYTITLNGGYYGGPAVPLLDIFPKAKKWGYDGIEIEGKRPHGYPPDLSPKDRELIKKTAADNGLVISAISAYNDFSSPVEEHRQNEILNIREQIKLARDVGAPYIRVFSFWSGVTMRNGAITYDVARHDQLNRYPGTTPLEQWTYVRECLAETARAAYDEGVVLALQNHRPIIESYQDMLDFIHEVDSPGLKACLDAPLLQQHTEEHYRAALKATGNLMVHSHFGGRYKRLDDGRVVAEKKSRVDYALFARLAKEIVNFQGHTGYELCSPVLINHRHAGQEYGLLQAELAAKFMRQAIGSA
jgi:sugar phosphate isomerase/epimerase